MASAFFVYGGTAGSGTARISVSGRYGTWIFPLYSSETVIVPGPIGNTLVEISGGKAYIAASPCRNQTCVAMPPVRRHGQWTACLPNQVMITVDGGEAPSATAEGASPGSPVDAVTW